MACTVVLLCGPPACGKSELLRLLESRMPNSTSIVFDEVFSIDAQQRAVHEGNGFRNLRERFLEVGRGILDRFTCTVCGDDTAHKCTEHSSHLIIVEDNFYLRSMRYKWFQEIRARELSFCTVFFTTSIEDCFQRNQRRTHPVPESVIREQFAKLEIPDSDGNVWEKFSLLKPSPVVEDVVTLISAAEVSPFPRLDIEQQCERLELARQQTKASRVHQIDLAFRRAVSVLIKNAPPSGRKHMYARLNKLKPLVISSDEIFDSVGEITDANVSYYLETRLKKA